MGAVRPTTNLVESDESGLQPIDRAWEQVLASMRSAYDHGDLARAVELGDRYLKRDPTHTGARLYVRECRAILEGRLGKRLAPLDRRVVLLVPLEELAHLRIDPRSAFVLSRIEEGITIEDLLDVTGMPRADAMAVIDDCRERGYVAFG